MGNPDYKSDEILFINKFKLTDALLSRDALRPTTGNQIDKQLFFLDKELSHKLMLL